MLINPKSSDIWIDDCLTHNVSRHKSDPRSRSKFSGLSGLQKN